MDPGRLSPASTLSDDQRDDTGIRRCIGVEGADLSGERQRGQVRPVSSVRPPRSVSRDGRRTTSRRVGLLTGRDGRTARRPSRPAGRARHGDRDGRAAAGSVTEGTSCSVTNATFGQESTTVRGRPRPGRRRPTQAGHRPQVPEESMPMILNRQTTAPTSCSRTCTSVRLAQFQSVSGAARTFPCSRPPHRDLAGRR